MREQGTQMLIINDESKSPRPISILPLFQVQVERPFLLINACQIVLCSAFKRCQGKWWLIRFITSPQILHQKILTRMFYSIPRLKIFLPLMSQISLTASTLIKQTKFLGSHLGP